MFGAFLTIRAALDPASLAGNEGLTASTTTAASWVIRNVAPALALVAAVVLRNAPFLAGVLAVRLVTELGDTALNISTMTVPIAVFSGMIAVVETVMIRQLLLIRQTGSVPQRHSPDAGRIIG